MPRPQELTDLAVGQPVALSFGGIEGELTLDKITTDDS